MLRRKPSMAFAPGAMVFPGGSVDPRDADEQVAWAGPAAEEWGQIFDAPRELARALVCAAVRETFEGKEVWDGVVHVFDLAGHPKATRAYAGSSPVEGTVLCRAALGADHGAG